jgi:hypothetical protein
MPGPPEPGSFGPLDAYSARPSEPVTHGAPLGAGAGPEALPQTPVPSAGMGLSAMLNQVARSTGSAAVAMLASHAAANGQ